MLGTAVSFNKRFFEKPASWIIDEKVCCEMQARNIFIQLLRHVLEVSVSSHPQYDVLLNIFIQLQDPLSEHTFLIKYDDAC